MDPLPIAPGSHDLAELDGVVVSVTNTSAVDAATVSITGPDGTEVWACSLGPRGSATFSQAIASGPLPAGRYTMAVTGTVVGTFAR